MMTKMMAVLTKFMTKIRSQDLVNVVEEKEEETKSEKSSDKEDIEDNYSDDDEEETLSKMMTRKALLSCTKTY